MKTLLAALFAFVVAGRAGAGYLYGRVDLYSHLDGRSFFSNGLVYWNPCSASPLICFNLTFSGRHMISFDGISPDGLIAYNWIPDTNYYSESIESTQANCGAWYRARISVTVNSSQNPPISQAWGTAAVRTDECDGPSSYLEPGDNQSPIVIAFDGDPDSVLSSPRNPVSFDILADGYRRDISWTRRGAHAGFLALDRDGNGSIDSGAELFGNHTPSADGRPPRPDSNGYGALAGYDFAESGGNEDGVISPQDAVWPDLRVWIDSNHDGFSQTEEIFSLDRMGLVEIALDYSIRSHKDRHGNLFRFESHAVTRDATGQTVRIPTWDVFFVTAPDPAERSR